MPNFPDDPPAADFASAGLHSASPDEARRDAEAVAEILSLGKPLWRDWRLQDLPHFAALPPDWPGWAAAPNRVIAVYALAAGSSHQATFAGRALDFLEAGPPAPATLRVAAPHPCGVRRGGRFEDASLTVMVRDPAGLPDPLRRAWSRRPPAAVRVMRHEELPFPRRGWETVVETVRIPPDGFDAFHRRLTAWGSLRLDVEAPWDELAPPALPALRGLAAGGPLKECWASVEVPPHDKPATLAAVRPRLARPARIDLRTAFPYAGTVRKTKWLPYERPADADPAAAFRLPLNGRTRGAFRTRLDVLHPVGGPVVLDLQVADVAGKRRADAKLDDLIGEAGADFRPWTGDPWGRWE